jgi:hypothetical protein
LKKKRRKKKRTNVDKVDSAASDADAGLQGLLLSVEALEGRKEGRVNVEDAAAPLSDEIGRKNAHEPGQRNQVDLPPGQDPVQLGIVLFA